MPNLNGTAGDDILTGGAENDTLVGNAGHDQLNGSGGQDRLVGNSGADVLNGGDGDDTLYAGDESPPFNHPYYGNAYTPPQLDMGSEVDTLVGGAGDDRLFAGYGDNVDGGGNGYSGDYLYISFMGASAGVSVDFRLQSQVVGGGTIANIENISWVQGSDHNDNINVSSWSNNGYSNFTAVFGMGGNDHLTAGYYTGVLSGDAGNDVLDGRGSQYLQDVDGGDGDDILYGAYGFNTAHGGAGNDTIYSGGSTYGGTGDDLIIMQSSYYGGQVHGDEGNDEIRAAQSGNFIIGGVGGDTLTGDAAADTLISDRLAPGTSQPGEDMGAERDVLAGFGGNDTLVAGYGDDVDGGAGVDILRLSLGGATSGVTLDTTLLVAGQSMAVGGGTLNSIETLQSLRGSEFNDTLTLATQSSLLSVNAGAGDDVIRSFNSSVSVQGGAGADRFISGAAGDTFDGGSGIDAVDYGFYASGVTVNLATGSGAGGDLLSNVENVAGSGHNDSLTGDAEANILRGAQGDDTINGGDGVDTAVFSGAFSGYVVTVGASGLIVTGADGTDTLTGVERLQFSDVTHTVVGGSLGADILSGSADGELLLGGADDDSLRGRGGADILNGGAGVDTADYSAAAGAVRAQLNSNSSSNDGDGGTDTFVSIENLTGSAFNDTLIGDANANVLRGGLGADVLLGLAGADVLWGGSGVVNQLQGGLGDDRYILEANDSVVEVAGEGNDTVEARINAYVLALNVENLVFGGTGNFAATGNAQANTITGGVGNDNLRGRGGVDVLNGGAGVDTADYTLAAAGVTARLDTNRATNDGDGATDTFTGVENLTGSQFNDLLIGNAGNNVLHGGIGTDTLLGFGGDDILWGGSGGGNNQLQGGTGNDYYVLDAFDTCVELAGEGIDTVEARIGSYTMGANIENLLYVGGTGTFVGTGNALDNTITGGNGNDILRGRGGNDTINGGLGKDEIQMRGLAADYTVVADGAGWRITDSVAGRDGSTFVTSIEVIRWSNNQTRLLTYPSPAAATAEVGAKGGAEVSPLMAADADHFVLPALASDQAQVLPSLTFAEAFDGFDVASGLADRLFLGLEARMAHHDGGLFGFDHGGFHAGVSNDDWVF